MLTMLVDQLKAMLLVRFFLYSRMLLVSCEYYPICYHQPSNHGCKIAVLYASFLKILRRKMWTGQDRIIWEELNSFFSFPRRPWLRP